MPLRLTTIRRTTSIVALIVLGLTLAAPVQAQDKTALWTQLVDLGQQIEQLKEQLPAERAQYDALLGQYEQISAQLGGDDPASLVGGSMQTNATRAVPSAPPGCSATTTPFTDPANTAIPDGPGGTLSRTITVSGVDPFLFDLDLTTVITHTFPGDLDITLTSPAGTVVVVTTDNGGTNDNVFNGTLWDDQALSPPTDAVYAANVTETPLTPEGAFGAFVGEDPNGIWTLTIGDDASTDTGTLVSWSLGISTLAAVPTLTPVLGSDPANAAIPDGPGGTLSRTITIAGADPYLMDVDLTTVITHTFPGDLDITLTSPAGTVVVVTTDNGGTNDNVFNGTLWDDQALSPPTDAVYATNVTETPLTPEGAFGAFVGEDPNGIWTLTIGDDASFDTGTLVSWSLDITTAECVALQADLAITKTADVATAMPGDQVVYTITVTNNGPGDATNVVVSDVLPAGVTYVSDTCGGSEAGGTWTWTIPSLTNGAQASCDVTVLVTGGAATLVNTATVSSDLADPSTGDNASTITVALQARGIPAVGSIGLGVLLLTILGAGILILRRM